MGDDREYKVIHETIVPKKMSRIKKFFKTLAFLVCGAIIFGVTERMAFEYSGTVFSPFIAKKHKKEKVELINSQVKLKKEAKNEGKDEKHPKEGIIREKTVVQKDIKVVEKKLNLSDYADIMREYGKVAEAKNKSVVEVRAAVLEKDWFENPFEKVTSTSGFIMAKQGDIAYILTRYSKIKKATSVKLTLAGGIHLDGVLKNYNSFLDLAILSASLEGLKEEEVEELYPVDIPSDEFINLGRPVMALGNPDGNLYSALFGQVTNTRGLYFQPDYVFDAFYTDIPLRKENFSLLMDSEGKVLGIGFWDKEEAETKVLVTGRVVRLIENMINDKPTPYLGIISKEFSGAENKTGREGGILIDSVAKASPAEKAGFQEGDILYMFGSSNIITIEDYLEALESKTVGEMVKFKVYRISRNKGSELEIEAIIGDSRGLK